MQDVLTRRRKERRMTLKHIDASFISMFLESMQTTFAKVYQTELCRGAVSFWKDEAMPQQLAVLTGVSGPKYTGMVAYRMRNETAARMVQALDPSSPEDPQGADLYEGLGEVFNILSGNTVSHFARNDVAIDITTPSVVTGDGFRMYLLNQTTLRADMMSPFGTIQVNIAIKKF
jgi:CheY-specific phosphatase CheX